MTELSTFSINEPGLGLRPPLADAEYCVKRSRFATPVVREDCSIGSTQDMAKHQRGDDGVVQRADDREELRDQVDGREEPCHGKPQPLLAASRDARVTVQPPKQDHEVRDESRQLASLRTSTEDNQNEDREEPHADDDAESDEEILGSSGAGYPGAGRRRLLGVSIREYRELEAGARSPTFETWEWILQVLGSSIRDETGSLQGT